MSPDELQEQTRTYSTGHLSSENYALVGFDAVLQYVFEFTNDTLY